MDLKTFLKNEEPKWVQFLSVNAFSIPGVEPSAPFLTDFPRASKDRLKEVLLGVQGMTLEKANEIYNGIKQKAANLYAQRYYNRNMEKVHLAAGLASTAVAMVCPRSTPTTQLRIMQKIAVREAIRTALGR
jgi:hypothetical protein